MKIDVRRVKKAIFSTGLSKAEFASKIGLGERALYYLLKRGSTTEERAFIIESAIEEILEGSEDLKNEKMEGVK